MNLPKHDSDLRDALRRNLASYWNLNVRILIVLLTLWAGLGLGCGILWADWLNRFSVGGYPLGFWFAQQGSIIGFVILILVYCLLMNRLDAWHHTRLEQLTAEHSTGKPATDTARPRSASPGIRGESTDTGGDSR